MPWRKAVRVARRKPSAASRRRDRPAGRDPESRCFQTEKYSVGDRGLHAVTEQPRHGDDISLPRYLAHTDAAARSVVEASPAERDPRLLDYFKVRKTMG